MEYLLIGIGGSLGALARYFVGKLLNSRSNVTISIGTMFVNITGALLMGIVTALSISNDYLYLFITEGFLGAYTTFSTFMYEGFTIFKNREKLNMIIYFVGTVVFGIIFYALGYNLTNII